MNMLMLMPDTMVCCAGSNALAFSDAGRRVYGLQHPHIGTRILREGLGSVNMITEHSVSLLSCRVCLYFVCCRRDLTILLLPQVLWLQHSFRMGRRLALPDLLDTLCRAIDDVDLTGAMIDVDGDTQHYPHTIRKAQQNSRERGLALFKCGHVVLSQDDGGLHTVHSFVDEYDHSSPPVGTEHSYVVTGMEDGGDPFCPCP